MKRLISLILIMVFAFAIGTVVYAANDDTDITDSEVPGAPAENVLDNTYEDLEDEDIAAGDPDTSFETVDIEEEEPPKADALPATGGIPAQVFYVIGALFIMAALILFRKKASAK
jgi:LPXTG-motif cell wall-anchored protein